MKLAMIKLAELPKYAALLNEWQANELGDQCRGSGVLFKRRFLVDQRTRNDPIYTKART
jgi:hypothetical protein